MQLSSSAEIIIIGLYSTIEMKKHNESGYNQNYLNSPGHFALLKLDVINSSIQFFDSLGSSLAASSYFSYGNVLRFTTELHNYLRTRKNLPFSEVSFSDKHVQNQVGSNCGSHALINCEILLNNWDPSTVHFNSSLISNVRRYHLLMAMGEINEFRLAL